MWTEEWQTCVNWNKTYIKVFIQFYSFTTQYESMQLFLKRCLSRNTLHGLIILMPEDRVINQKSQGQTEDTSLLWVSQRGPRGSKTMLQDTSGLTLCWMLHAAILTCQSEHAQWFITDQMLWGWPAAFSLDLGTAPQERLMHDTASLVNNSRVRSS